MEVLHLVISVVNIMSQAHPGLGGMMTAEEQNYK